MDQTNENNEQHCQHQAELKARAETDEQARATLERAAEKRRENCRKRRTLKRERMANDPAFAEQERMKARARDAKRREKQKARRQELKLQSETDPQAAAELAAIRAKDAANAAKYRKRNEERIGA